MPLVNMKDMLDHAYHHGYAVGAFELINLDFLQSILEAAEQARAPVILSLGEHHFKDYDFELLMPAVEAAAKRSLVPVTIHFDHGKKLSSAITAIQQGCNSVMVDASHLDFPENTQITQSVVAMAHACGIAVEGELGYVPGIKTENDSHTDDLAFTSLAEAKAYVERTHVDFLAVSIGTVHGKMKGKPKLDYQRLKKINEALKIPLVIHGGSGLSDSQYRRLISNGIVKINCFTSIFDLALQKLRENTRSTIGLNYSQIQHKMKDAIRVEIEYYLRLWGAAGRAAEVLSQCQLWTSVEQLLIYKTTQEQTVYQSILLEVKSIITKIPGVKDVSMAEIINHDKHYQCAWTIKFCHHKAIKLFKENSQVKALYRKLFSSLDDDLLSFYQQEFIPVIL